MWMWRSWEHQMYIAENRSCILTPTLYIISIHTLLFRNTYSQRQFQRNQRLPHSFSESPLLTSGGKYETQAHTQVNNFVFLPLYGQSCLHVNDFPLLLLTLSTFSPSACRLWTPCSSAATCCWQWRVWSSSWHCSCCFPFISWSQSMPRP